MTYVGRFAPSPTGPLHLGSMLTAVASYLDARANNGKWLIRIEDVDTERCLPEWTPHIIDMLAAYGMYSDELIIIQSERGEFYEQALAKLAANGHTYRCICSRKQVAQSGVQGIDGWVYSGTCRDRNLPSESAAAIRLMTHDGIIHCNAEGYEPQNVYQTVGDFVLKRADGLYSYQLACVVDDAEQGITHIVRGRDLESSTARQVTLQQALVVPAVHSYRHLPLIVNEQGEKLSKQTCARAVTVDEVKPVLRWILRALEQPLPDSSCSVDEMLVHATAYWNWSFMDKAHIDEPGVL
jgi:glutamyl-Q tRNA(Asp) synthetase